jgi:predicted transcriptional regulator
MSDDKDTQEFLATLTADIVSAHVSNNSVSAGELPALISSVYTSLSGLGAAPASAEKPGEPAVPIRSSIKPDYIVCLEDGKKLKMLKRHLMTHYQMTPEQYRARWGLPSDYPMVAPNYAETRRTLALAIGLGKQGRGGGRKPAAAAKPPAKKPAASKAEAKAALTKGSGRKPGRPKKA